jgi:hypothetical protein
MNNERRAILSLIAMGRITPREAERLLACWPDSSEIVWVVGACAVTVAAMAFGHPGELAHVHELLETLANLSKTILSMADATSHQSLSFFTSIAGGTL